MSTTLLNPWDVREADFPSTGTSAEKLRFLVNYAILAPSGHNTQPWLFKIDDKNLELYADRTRALPVVDPDDRELTISCGAALFHLRLALRHFGYMGAVTIFPDPYDPDLLARVDLGDKGEAPEEDQALFDAISKRHTNRQAFEPRAVPDAILTEFQQVVQTAGVWFSLVQGEEDRNAVADLIAVADLMQWADKHFRRELAAWARPSHSKRLDGIPGNALNFAGLVSHIGLRAGRTFDLGNGQAASDRQLVAGSPVLAVLGTDRETPYDWLLAGQALARVLLYARSQGIWASFLNQPIEVPDVRHQFRSLIRCVGFPQLLLRMGYGAEVPPTPRRSGDEVLL